MFRSIRFLWLVALLFAAIVPVAQASEAFPRPAALESDIAFWRRIYTEVGTDGGLIHDPVRLDVVYEVMKFPADLSARERSRRIEDTKKKYSRILDRLANDAHDLSPEELRVQALWPKGTRRSRFEQAAEDVRFQLGQADRFLEGVIRSGAYKDHIAATFGKMGLPRELAALPHVESSFNTYAYSKWAPPACGSSCAGRAGVSCASTAPWTSGWIPIVRRKQRRAFWNRTTSCSAAGRWR